MDPSLDFLSQRFDPLKALQASSSSLSLPCPDVQPFDNISQYQALIRGAGKRQGAGAGIRPQGRASEEEKNRVKTGSGGEMIERNARKMKTVLDFMTGIVLAA